VFLENPDSETVIDSPTPDDIIRELRSLDGGDLSDSCVDLCISDENYIQAIGCEKWGFHIEFQTGGLQEHYRSTSRLSFALTSQVLLRYLARDPSWKSLFTFLYFDTTERRRLVVGPVRRLVNALFAGPSRW